MATLCFCLFVLTAETFNVVRDAKYICGLLVDIIKKFGKENVVQIDTKNDNNFKKSRNKIIEKYNLFQIPCATYCIEFILKVAKNMNVVKW